MKKIFVNPRNYTNFIYDAFIDRSGNGIARPQGEILYEVGQVVYVISENSIGVVLGVIGVTSEELRTDIDGMKLFFRCSSCNLRSILTLKVFVLFLDY